MTPDVAVRSEAGGFVVTRGPGGFVVRQSGPIGPPGPEGPQGLPGETQEETDPVALGALSGHAALETDVHGIPDTSVLVITTDLDSKQDVSEKGVANGYPSLDSGGKVPAEQMPFASQLYKGLWNANTNSPTLVDGTGTAGDNYIISTTGTRSLGSSSQTWDAGNSVYYNGTTWQETGAPTGVTTVDGLGPGAVTLPSDAAAGTASKRSLGTTSTKAAAGNDSRFPTAGEKLALAGTSGTPGTGNEYVTQDTIDAMPVIDPTGLVAGDLVEWDGSQFIRSPGGGGSGTVDSRDANLLITPTGTTDCGIIVKAPSSAWGNGTAYGEAQAFMLLREDAGGVEPDGNLLFRVNGYDGGVGICGGVHVATGLNQRVGYAVPQAMWIQPSIDTINLRISPAAAAPTQTASYMTVKDKAGTALVEIDSTGKLLAQMNLDVLSGAAATLGQIRLGRTAVEGGLAVQGSGTALLLGALAGDLIVTNYGSTRRVVIGAGVAGQTPAIIAGNNTLGFHGAFPVAKPTGVAVTAAGIHAALVTLGLIAA